MSVSFFAVVTTIQPPNAAMCRLSEKLEAHDGQLIVIGDRKGPQSFDLPRTLFYSLADQLEMPNRLAAKLPTGHYARKNLGYLQGISRGAPSIFETDDDNAPLENWAPRSYEQQAETWRQPGWFNVYRLFSADFLWPRGLPLDRVRAPLPPAPVGESLVCAPVQQGLVDGSPDVDAVWRLLLDRDLEFTRRTSVVLAPGTWCPFNSQCTWWWPAAYPLLYLPCFASFRMTDIWRGLVAQRCLWELGHGVLFHSPEMSQDRNVHDLMRDFQDEVPGYLNNSRISQLLDGARLEKGEDAVAENLIRCYEVLVQARLLPEQELDLARTWVSDFREVIS
ncbi:MAG: STELLO glycosyltransferase family protein [Acidobacteriota bacterium]